MKMKYSITYHGITGKLESLTIEATNVKMSEGSEGNNLVFWIRGKRTVFALPSRFLIETRVVDEPKLGKIRQLKRA